MNQAQQQINNLYDISRKKAIEQAEESKREQDVVEEEQFNSRSYTFLEEQRRSVIEHENTAQPRFLDFLETLSPETNEIQLREPLSGDIDLAILKECNFHNIDTIVFQKGKITHVRNIPLGIKRFDCPENLLIELDNLPDTLIELNIHHNYVKHLELSELKNLKTLNISNNQFSRIYDLPEKIETILCDNNHLTTLDLKGLNHLKTLHCSNNRMIRIENFPEDTIRDFVMENNPLTNIQNAGSNDADGDEEKGPSVDFQESLETYFELKQVYEKAAYKIKKETFDKAPSKRSARELLKQIKPKCVNCKRPVGSIFMTNNRTYSAKCGDQKAPCNLNIKIYAGVYENLMDFIEKFQTYVDDAKDDIIKQKLDTLFNYINESKSVELFKKQFEEYSELSQFLKELMDEYTDTYLNEERELKMAKKLTEIYRIKERLTELFNSFKESEDMNLLRDAMKVYVDDLKPEMNNLRLLQYSLCEMVVDGSKSRLIQHEIPLVKRDFSIGSSFPKVQQFTKN